MNSIKEFTHIDWEQFHFLRPVFLWLLIPVVIILILNLITNRNSIKWKSTIAPHLRKYVIQKGSEHLKKWMQFFTMLTLALAILGLAGPTWKEVEVPGKILETPVVIALDLSQSMLATDIQPNRLERAKFKISDLIDANPRARISLVGFAGSAHTIVPLTNDYRIIKSHISTLSPNVMPFGGSNLQAALEVTDTIINVTTAPATLILFSDDFDEETFNLLQNFATTGNTQIEIVPFNTTTGADVPNFNGRGFLKEQGKNVHSSLNTDILNRLDAIENITVHALTLDNSDMELLAKKIADNIEFKEQDEEKEDDWEDHGLVLIIPFVFMVFLSFRKGWVLYSLVFMMTFSSCSSDTSFKDFWFTKDYQGQQLIDKEEYALAGDTFDDPLQKGVAYYKANDYDAAITAFSKDTTAMGAYNLGVAYFANGDYAAAEIAFGNAVELDPDMENAKSNMQISQHLSGGENEVNPEDAEEATEKGQAQNEQNKSPEDLSGGGQEATKEQMEKERLEETVNTDVRKGKELDEVPDNFETGKQDNSQKVLMRKVDDDPSLFLKRKFKHQAKEKNLKQPKNIKQW